MENCQLFSTGYRIGRYFYNSIRTLFSRISSIHRFSTVSHQKFTSNVRERKNNEKYVQIKLNLMKLFVRNSNYSDDMFEFFLFFFLSDLDIWIWELTHWRKEREGEDWITVARGYASHNINTYAYWYFCFSIARLYLCWSEFIIWTFIVFCDSARNFKCGTDTSSMNLFFFSFVFQLFVRSAMLLIDDSEFFAQQIIDNQFEFHFRPLIHSAYESKCVRWITAFIAADRSINHWFQYLVSVCEKFFPVSILALRLEAHNLTMRRKNFEVSYAIYLNRSVSSCICPRAPSLDRPKIGCVRSSL